MVKQQTYVSRLSQSSTPESVGFLPKQSDGSKTRGEVAAHFQGILHTVQWAWAWALRGFVNVQFDLFPFFQIDS